MKGEERTLTLSGKNSLYATTNGQYGSAWAQDNGKLEHSNIKHAKVPTYSEIVESMNDFRKTQRLIKNKIIQEKLERDGIDIHSENQRYLKKTEFHVKNNYQYPPHGLNVGPPIYRTNNMNYGSSLPAPFEIQNKYFPCNNTFTSTFNGGNYKFEGLNTIKTISKVHNQLNDL